MIVVTDLFPYPSVPPQSRVKIQAANNHIVLMFLACQMGSVYHARTSVIVSWDVTQESYLDFHVLLLWLSELSGSHVIVPRGKPCTSDTKANQNETHKRICQYWWTQVWSLSSIQVQLLAIALTLVIFTGYRLSWSVRLFFFTFF